ncbi:MAG: DUF2887 domain-containing protein [Synechococcaceae cyanobacterium RM1_1_27]|nr:DUF2887 domain-containing protein [Synechococcaceae cyanobacterium RM1_1_27]
MHSHLDWSHGNRFPVLPLFQIYPGLLFELLDLPPHLAQNYRFSSVEVKQLAFRIDGIFLPQQDGDPLFFVEVQFQRDERLYARLFAEIFSICLDTSSQAIGLR